MTALVPQHYLEPELHSIIWFIRDADNILTPRGINLRPLKKAVAMLPNYASIDNNTSWLLEQIQAIVFHISYPLNSRVAEDFFDEHYIPTRERPLTSVEASQANELLLSLGLPTKVHSAVSGTLKRRI